MNMEKGVGRAFGAFTGQMAIEASKSMHFLRGLTRKGTNRDILLVC